MTEPDSLPQDGRQFAPATARNRDPILAILKRVLPPEGTVLEIASGTGEHAVYFAQNLEPRYWLPSDPAPDQRVSVNAWAAKEPCDRLQPPLNIDVTQKSWPVERILPSPPITAIVAINMIHIAPWQACLGLMAGAGRILRPGHVLYLYGPFMRGGVHTAPSNASFDEMLQSQDPRWGVRDMEDVVDAARAQGLDLTEIIEMPVNNLSLAFKRL